MILLFVTYWMNYTCLKKIIVMHFALSSAKLEFHYLASMPSSNQHRRKRSGSYKPHSLRTSTRSTMRSEECRNHSLPSLWHSTACSQVRLLDAKVCLPYVIAFRMFISFAKCEQHPTPEFMLIPINAQTGAYVWQRQLTRHARQL